jgi:hypothetical protein
MKKKHNTHWFFGIMILVLILLVFGRFTMTGYLVGGDGEGYYSYLPSMILDRDLNFSNQYAHLPRIGSDNPFLYVEDGTSFEHVNRTRIRVTPTGLIDNVVPIGTSLFWLPFFLLGELVNRAAKLLGMTLLTNGFSPLTQFITLIASPIYAVLGLMLASRIGEQLGIDRLSMRIAILIMLSASFALQYFAVEPSMSHAIDFFILTALFALTWDVMRGRRTNTTFFLLGLAAGLAIAVRPQNALTVLICGIGVIFVMLSEREQSTALRRAVPSVIGGLTGLIPLLVSWHVLYGNALTIPQGDGFLNPQNPAILELLFSFHHSLFVSTPILLIGMIGFFILLRRTSVSKGKEFLWVLLVSLALQIYINSIVIDWWAGNALGARRFLGMFLPFILGTGYLVTRFKEWKMPVKIGSVVGTLIITALNSIYFITYNLNLIDRGAPVSYIDILVSFWTFLTSFL